jgi:hypothetical protein
MNFSPSFFFFWRGEPLRKYAPRKAKHTRNVPLFNAKKDEPACDGKRDVRGFE